MKHGPATDRLLQNLPPLRPSQDEIECSRLGSSYTEMGHCRLRVCRLFTAHCVVHCCWGSMGHWPQALWICGQWCSAPWCLWGGPWYSMGGRSQITWLWCQPNLWCPFCWQRRCISWLEAKLMIHAAESYIHQLTDFDVCSWCHTGLAQMGALSVLLEARV